MIVVLKVHDFPAVLSSLESWLLHGGLLGYLIAALLALLGLFWPRRFGLASMHAVAVLATCAMAGYFISRFASSGAVPLGNVVEVLLLIGCGLVLAYFAFMLRKPVPALGAWVLPMVVIIMLMALPLGGALGPASVDEEHRSVMDATPLLIAHIVLAVVATAQFALAFVIATLFLLQDRAVRSKKDHWLSRTLPSLEALERMVVTAISIGLAVLTVSLACGFAVVWSEIGDWIVRPRVLASLAMWVVFLVVLLARYNHAFRGRREMYLVSLGFVFVITVYLFESGS